MRVVINLMAGLFLLTITGGGLFAAYEYHQDWPILHSDPPMVAAGDSWTPPPATPQPTVVATPRPTAAVYNGGGHVVVATPYAQPTHCVTAYSPLDQGYDTTCGRGY